jgi:FAD/FMN-containing dehydrogenase
MGTSVSILDKLSDCRWNNVISRNAILTGRLYDKNAKGERRKAEDLVHEMVDTALEMEGTCTGGITLQTPSNPEHGVGMVKKSYLVQELGLETVETMRRIKVISPISKLTCSLP